MTLRLPPIAAGLIAGVAGLCFHVPLAAQEARVERVAESVVLVAPVSETELPDAPLAQDQQTAAKPPAGTPAATQSAGDASSAAQTAPQSAEAQKSQKDVADEQLKAQEKQRILGFLPSFNVSYLNDSAVSLTWKQKYKLAFTSAIDPYQFGLAAFVAGISQARGSDYGYGGGIGGYAKRFGSSYADAFNGAMIGNAILPSLLHQDPRYFRRGYGSKTKRTVHALVSAVWCKHDNSDRWEPNYSNVFGNIAAGGISNLYAPQDERGWGNTFEGAALVTVEGGLGSILQEFWPDISRHYFHKDPTHGQDAINNATKK
jgi:hypothetical protein